ncbi:MAG TPA: hypothetical protein VME45_21305 [Stellaceae bacterium]|nr:hypothetical protein [Stellaceae bacterium]
MRGSPISNPVRRPVPALLGGVGAVMLLAAPLLAADPAPSASIGPPTPLLPVSPPPSGASFATAPFVTTPAHIPAPAPSPGKHAGPPVQRIPLDAKPLIPPAAVPAKLGPPPDPRSALSLETDLEPLGPAAAVSPQPGPAGGAAPPAANPSSS